MGLLHMELPRPSLFTCKSSRAGDTLFCQGSKVTGVNMLYIPMPSIVSNLQDFILATWASSLCVDLPKVLFIAN